MTVTQSALNLYTKADRLIITPNHTISWSEIFKTENNKWSGTNIKITIPPTICGLTVVTLTVFNYTEEGIVEGPPVTMSLKLLHWSTTQKVQGLSFQVWSGHCCCDVPKEVPPHSYGYAE